MIRKQTFLHSVKENGTPSDQLHNSVTPNTGFIIFKETIGALEAFCILN